MDENSIKESANLLKEESSTLMVVSGGGLFILGAIILFYPKVIFVNIVKGIGVFLIAYAIIDALLYFLLFKRSKQILKLFK